MKKVLIVLSSAMILAAGASSSVSAFEHDANMDSYVQKFKDGTFISDTNRDGKFTFDDVEYINQYYGTKQTSPDIDKHYSAEEQAFVENNFDYNNDELINSLDAVTLLYYYVHSYLPENYSMGDTNLDGVVNAVDASNILEYYALDSTSFTDEYSRSKRNTISGLGDINNDGNINALDASLILTSYADAQTK